MMWRASYPHLSKNCNCSSPDLYKSLTILLPWRCISFSPRACFRRRPYCQNKHRQRQFYFLSLAFGTRTRSWDWDVLCRVPTKQRNTGVRVFQTTSHLQSPRHPLSCSLSIHRRFWSHIELLCHLLWMRSLLFSAPWGFAFHGGKSKA